MSKYTKYKLYQKYETRGSQEAIPCYPNLFSIDGDGTMPLVIVEENSRDCGYTGETQPIYRWYQLPIDTYYYCDACQDAQYKWVNLPISQDWECVGTTKYYKQKKMVSVDGGSTWTDVEPPQYQRGALYEQNSSSCGYRTRTSSGSPYCEQYDKYVDVYSQYSTDGGNTWQTTATTPTMVEHNSEYCGYIEPQYRTTSGATYCSGYNKYVPVYSQVSYDGGVTWETTATTQTLVERNSPDCGYAYKLRGTFSDTHFYDIVCNNNTTLTMSEAQNTNITGMSSADIGTCVTEIADCAFDNGVQFPNLVSINLPNTLTRIGGGAFIGCDSLTSITIPNSVTSMGNYAFSTCDSLKSVVIGNGLTSISEGTFSGDSSLTSVTIGSNVSTIGYMAFQDCDGLSSLTIPNSVTTIGAQAFYDCSNLTSVTVGSGVSTISGAAFSHCTSLQNITLPNTVASIGEMAFNDCSSLTSATIGNSITALSYNTFAECSNLRRLNSNIDGVINIPNRVTSIGNAVFKECLSFTSVAIPSSVTTIGNRAFESCSGLTSVTIPDSVTSIGEHVFGECSGLTSVEIGSGITTIGNYAFQRCIGLISYTIKATTPPSIGEWAFNDTTGCPIYVPCDSVEDYKSASDWSNFKNRIQPIEGTCATNKFKATYSNTTVYQKACDSDTTLTSGETRPNGYTYSAMTSAEVGDCVTTIGGRAFGGCSGLTSCTIGSGVTTIGRSAFFDCSSLTSIDIPNSVTNIDDWAFQGCSNLSNFTIPSGVTSVNSLVFGNCTSLTSVTMPSGVTTIGTQAFYRCTSLSSITIPNTVTSIGNTAFSGCTSLGSIDIPSSVTSIGSYAFHNCSALTSVTVNAITPPTSTDNAFDSTNNCPIYVPAASVETYKAASGWSYYANRIQAIQPTIQTKWIATYSDSHTESAECDSTSAITSDEINKTNLVSAEIGDCVTSIGNDAFRDCTGLTSCTIGSGVTSIGERSFQYCSSFTSIDIPSGVTSIAGAAFDSCTGLTSIDIPNSVTSIGESAFGFCSSLTSIDIPDSVTSIGDFVFYGCRSLTSVTVNATTPPTLGEVAFDNTNNCPIYVPAASVETYKSASGWSSYASRIQAIP